MRFLEIYTRLRSKGPSRASVVLETHPQEDGLLWILCIAYIMLTGFPIYMRNHRSACETLMVPAPNWF